MKISIAMAVYNGAPFLVQQLDSFADQTCPPDEIVISDDGSTDGSIGVIREWATRHRSINLRLLEGRGPGNFSQNFIRAFKATTGDLIFPSDQDDVWLPDKIAVMADLMLKDDHTMVALHDVEITDAALQPIGQRMISRLQAMGDKMDHSSGMAMVVRRDFLRLCYDVPLTFTYDNWINHCARGLGVKRLVDRPLALYRRHDDAITVKMLQNSPRKKSKFTTKLAYIRSVISRDGGGRDLISVLDKASATATWLEANRVTLNNIGVSVTVSKTFASRLADLVSATESRIVIRNLSRMRRPIPIIALLRRGGYRHFRGFGAAVKDFVL